MWPPFAPPLTPPTHRRLSPPHTPTPGGETSGCGALTRYGAALADFKCEHDKLGVRIQTKWLKEYMQVLPASAQKQIGRGMNMAAIAMRYKRHLSQYAQRVDLDIIRGGGDTHEVEAQPSAVAEMDPASYHQRFAPKHMPRGRQNADPRFRPLVQDHKRRRARGGGRKPVAAAVRESLLLWWNGIRHSINTKLMVRFPLRGLLLKAKDLQAQYIAASLHAGVTVSPLQVNRAWLKKWMCEYRISVRQPIRKYKVARDVLCERLQIFWITVAKIRTAVKLHFGYDPDFKNVDQSPFHMNEAGSQECKTLSVKGAYSVPLIENHAATRERWSLNSITDSNQERVNKRAPGFEIMFKAEGHKLEAKLKEYLFSLGLPCRASVVTGPSGSYKEEDILNFLEEHLEKWGPGRRWEVFMLDAYAPGLTNNVQRLCWLRGYIVITHGGGASMVCQTNDTDYHLHVRKRFIELQDNLMIHKSRSRGGGLVDLTKEENIRIMAEVALDTDLNLGASAGYKRTGTTNALDGSEDHLITREAGNFWNELRMRPKIDSAVAEVTAR